MLEKMSSFNTATQAGPNIYFIQLSTFRRPLLIFGFLIGLSVYLNRSAWQDLSLWEYCAFSTLPIALLALFLCRKRMYIQFDDNRLMVHYINGKERHYAWTDITKVGIVSFKRPIPTVVLRLRDDSPALTAQNKVYRAMSGYDVALPAFLAPAKELSGRIEQIRLSKGAPIS